jgi:3-deoxy-D-manno-octulosonate 8-phosphate phosphatase (KDO 8-P phosphatase)
MSAPVPSAASAAGIPSAVAARARAIRLLACDVDGVFTDGSLQFFADGDRVLEGKSFSILDGYGVKLLQETGVAVALITGRRSAVVTARAREMGVRHVLQGREDKKAAWSELLAELSLRPEESAYIGDDWPDLAVIRACGLGISVPNAPERVRREAHHVTRAAGGAGAVREVCELIMDAQGTLAARFAQFGSMLQ